MGKINEGTVLNMKEVKKNRNSNFELMRIISMIYIIIFHVFIHGNILDNSTGGTYILLIILQALVIVHVNSYVVVTGYFQCEKQMKFSKFLSTNNAMWFYKAILMIIFVIIGLDHPSKIQFLKAISPINYMDYWFVGLYLILYLISPIINKLIHCLTKRQYQKLLVLLFLILCVLSTFTRQTAYNNICGYSLGNFIFLYLIGAYIKLYSISENNIFKKLTINTKKILFFSIYIALALLNGIIYIFGKSLIEINSSIFQELGYIISESYTSFCSPIVVIQTVSFFLFFSCLTIKNKLINKIATCTFGVYLIHENIHLQQLIYKPFGFLQKGKYSYGVILKIVYFSVIVFFVCWIIEFLRQVIFKFIYKRKISLKFREYCKKYIKSLGININW